MGTYNSLDLGPIMCIIYIIYYNLILFELGINQLEGL